MLGWWQDRQRSKEIERTIQTRRGKAEMRRHIRQQQQMALKLWDLGKRARAIGDDRQFQMNARQYLFTQQEIRRWESFLLSFEGIEARRDQVRATVEFVASLRAMSKSMLLNANPQQMADVQRELETAMERASSFAEHLDLMMDSMDQMVVSMAEADDPQLEASMGRLADEIDGEVATAVETETEESALDARIRADLQRIEEQMHADLNRRS